jgi:hypothetical protein
VAKKFVSVRSKIIGLVLVAAVLPMVISSVVTKIGTGSLKKTIDKHLMDAINDRVLTMTRSTFEVLKMNEDLNQIAVQTGIKSAESALQTRGGIGFNNEPVAWNAMNQFTRNPRK